MKVLSLEQCEDIIKRHKSGQPTWAICGELKVSSGVVKAIKHCKKHHYPLTDYLVIFDKLSKYKRIDEPIGTWDLRLSIRLSGLPMSKWADAIAKSNTNTLNSM